MSEPAEYVVKDEGQEVRFRGYKLGSVRVVDRQGEAKITAYFVQEDEDRESYMLTHIVTEGEVALIREDQSEYSFLGHYGARLAYALVWSPEGWGEVEPASIKDIRDWFPHYERWGC